MNETLNLIETTLYDQTGHGYSYTQCLINANAEFNYNLVVWLDRRGTNLLDPIKCTPQPYFIRSIRQIQKIILYYKLLRQPGIIFIGTSELWDLKVLAFWASKIKIKAKVFLHFHQFKQKPNKLASLSKIAAMNLGFNILTPTAKLAEIFKSNGFKCQVVACPTYHPAPAVSTATARFSKVLYAGAARSDKGFPAVVDAVAYNRSLGKDTVFEIQISAPASQRYDDATQVALQQLQNIPNTNLVLHRNTLDATQYLQLFNGAICLLIYSQAEYQDKFSGIVLDSLYAGTPIITVKNTWMGEVAEQYNVGIALSDTTPAAVQNAIEVIAQDYEGFHARAKAAALKLAQLHDPRNTLRVLGGFTF